MLRLIAVLAALLFVIPTYGQVEDPQTTQYVAANSFASYFSRLFSPESLPSIGLLIAGIAGIYVAVRTLRAIKEQAEIANRTLIAQFRPLVIVRHISLMRVESGSWNVQMQVDNVGGTNANIKGIELEIRWRLSNEPHRHQVLHTGSIEGFPLEAGGERSMSIPISDGRRCESKICLTELAFKEGNPRKYLMQAVGVIRYTDDSGAGRKTGFSRTLDSQTRRFVATKEAEDEYQD